MFGVVHDNLHANCVKLILQRKMNFSFLSHCSYICHRCPEMDGSHNVNQYLSNIITEKEKPEEHPRQSEGPERTTDMSQFWVREKHLKHKRNKSRRSGQKLKSTRWTLTYSFKKSSSWTNTELKSEQYWAIGLCKIVSCAINCQTNYCQTPINICHLSIMERL